MKFAPTFSIFLISLTLTATAESIGQFEIPSRNLIELELLPDSTCADSWASYALINMMEGRSDWCYYALEMGERCNDFSEDIYRVRASYEWLRGNRELAIGQLSNLPGNYKGRLINIAYLQENGNIDIASQLLDELDAEGYFCSDAAELLTARQLRLTGNTAEASVCIQEILNRSEVHPLMHNVACLEAFLYCGVDFPPGVLQDCLNSDMTVFGGVHLLPLLEMLEETPPLDAQTLFLVCELLCILDRKEEAVQYLSSIPGSDISGSSEIYLIEILIDLDRLDDAMNIADRILFENPVDCQALELRGTLLLMGGKYEEAYYQMGNAAFETGSVQCTALQGLSAEMVGYQKLAFEKYAEVLRLSPDSIVLINRNRENISGTDPLELIQRSSAEPFSDYSFSGFSGGLGFSYYDNAGEYESRYISANTDLVYRYGLYGSNVNSEYRYSLNRWSGSDDSYNKMTASLAGQNYSSRRFYQELMIDWERSRYSQDRNRYEAVLGTGYMMEPLHNLKVTGFLGLGRSEETVDSESNDNWITVQELEFALRGDAIGCVVPRLVISGVSVINMEIHTGYELSLFARLSLNTGGPFTLSVGSNADQSYQSALNYYSARRNSFISLDIDYK